MRPNGQVRDLYTHVPWGHLLATSSYKAGMAAVWRICMWLLPISRMYFMCQAVCIVGHRQTILWFLGDFLWSAVIWQLPDCSKKWSGCIWISKTIRMIRRLCMWMQSCALLVTCIPNRMLLCSVKETHRGRFGKGPLPRAAASTVSS